MNGRAAVQIAMNAAPTPARETERTAKAETATKAPMADNQSIEIIF